MTTTPRLRAGSDHEGRPHEEIEQAINALEAPRSFRIEKIIREIVERDFSEKGGPGTLSLELLKAVDQLGLEPDRAPSPLPDIEQDEIRLVCWAAIV